MPLVYLAHLVRVEECNMGYNRRIIRMAVVGASCATYTFLTRKKDAFEC